MRVLLAQVKVNKKSVQYLCVQAPLECSEVREKPDFDCAKSAEKKPCQSMLIYTVKSTDKRLFAIEGVIKRTQMTCQTRANQCVLSVCTMRHAKT